MTAVHAYRALGDARLMVLVGGLPTLGDLTWIVERGPRRRGRRHPAPREGPPRPRAAQPGPRGPDPDGPGRGPRFMLNDRPDLARLAGADGVHLGQEDVTVRDARRIVGPNLLIGVSTHNRDQLDAAVLSGAGYLGVGPVFPSPTKEFSEPELAGLAYVQAAAETTNLPWFAIGGITERERPPRPRGRGHADRRQRRRREGRPAAEGGGSGSRQGWRGGRLEKKGAFDMLILANVQNALEQLWSNKLRSLLTVLGIVIAVTSTITVVGVIQGFTGVRGRVPPGAGHQRHVGLARAAAGRGGEAAGAGRAGRARHRRRSSSGCPALRRVSPLVRRPTCTAPLRPRGGDGPARGGLGRVPRDPQLPRRGRPAVRRGRRRAGAPRLRPRPRGPPQAQRSTTGSSARPS